MVKEPDSGPISFLSATALWQDEKCSYTRGEQSPSGGSVLAQSLAITPPPPTQYSSLTFFPLCALEWERPAALPHGRWPRVHRPLVQGGRGGALLYVSRVLITFFLHSLFLHASKVSVSFRSV